MQLIPPVLLIGMQAAIALILSRYLGAGMGLMVHLGLALAMSALGYWLLSRLTVNEINWRNRVAGVLMPWAAFVGGGSLQVYAFKNATASIAFAGMVIACDRLRAFDSAASEESLAGAQLTGPIWDWGTWIGWIVVFVVWLGMLKPTLTRVSPQTSFFNTIRRLPPIVLIPPAMFCTSVLLRLNGHPFLAFLTVAVPLVLAAMPLCLLFIVILFHFLMGKPMRWH